MDIVIQLVVIYILIQSSRTFLIRLEVDFNDHWNYINCGCYEVFGQRALGIIADFLKWGTLCFCRSWLVGNDNAVADLWLTEYIVNGKQYVVFHYTELTRLYNRPELASNLGAGTMDEETLFGCNVIILDQQRILCKWILVMKVNGMRWELYFQESILLFRWPKEQVKSRYLIPRLCWAITNSSLSTLCAWRLSVRAGRYDVKTRDTCRCGHRWLALKGKSVC